MSLTLARLSKDEVVNTMDNLLALEIATSDIRWECSTPIRSEGVSVPRQGMNQRLSNLKVFHDRRKEFAAKCEEKGLSSDNLILYKKGKYLIEQLIKMEENSTMAEQEKYFTRDKNLFLSHSFMEFPLDKKINALYDDIAAVFLMYEDVTTLGNNRAAVIESYGSDKELYTMYAENHIEDKAKREEFLKIRSVKGRVAWAKEYWGENAVDMFEALDTDGRVEFVKPRINLTHRLLGQLDNPGLGIAVTGVYANAYLSFTDRQCILPNSFCDFDKTTMKDTTQIRNNDLQQWIQSKLDLDKENFELLDEKTIRGDVYKLLSPPKEMRDGDNFNVQDYYVRYVCPSTSRKYYNVLSLETLRNSKYFEREDLGTYLPAWWHITHCGENPYAECETIRV